MQIYSSINNPSCLQSKSIAEISNLSLYNQLSSQYTKTGFTYKSNQIIQKISSLNPRDYPYYLLLYVAKTFHLNQFEMIFFSHILHEVEPCYHNQNEIFNISEHNISQETQNVLMTIIQQNKQILNIKKDEGSLQNDMFEIKKQFNFVNNNLIGKNNQLQDQYQDIQDQIYEFNLEQLKRIYFYLLVIGYAVKYYLNQQNKIKPYEQYLKSILPLFFSSIFNKWAKKYGNSVLNTTPRKINSFYMSLGFLQRQQDNTQQKPGQDCQYRNYNQIVQQLIKATTQSQQPPNQHIIKQEFIQQNQIQNIQDEFSQ